LGKEEGEIIMGNKSMKWYDWLFSFLISVTLIGVGVSAWTDFNLVSWMTFEIVWLSKIVYSIVAIFGFMGLWTIITKLLLKK